MEGHTTATDSVAASTPESCIVPVCSVDESVDTWPAGLQSFYYLEVLTCGGLQATLPSCFQCGSLGVGKAGLLGLIDVSFLSGSMR